MRAPGPGTLGIGTPEDVILLDLKALPFMPLNDLHRQLFHCQLGQSVLAAMVGGHVVAQDGRLTQINEAAILAEASALFASKKGQWT